SVSLAWSASSDDTGVSGYTVYRDGTSARAPTGTSYTVSGLNCGTFYLFAVEARDAAGNHSAQATLTASTSACPVPDTQAPTTPGSLAKSGSTQTSVSLAWSASSDDTGVSGYTVYRDGTSAGAPTGTSYTVSGLGCGTSYLFAVEARDAAGNHSAQATLTASTSACPVPDTQAPTTPGSLAKSGSTQTSVSLVWSASSDDTGVTGYTVYRDGTSAGAPTATSYTAPGLGCGTSYLFTVEARDAAGNHSAPANLTASTSACPVSDTQ